MRHSQKGITVIELMVAAVVLGFCTVPIVGSIALIRTNVAEAKVQALVQATLQNDLAEMATQGKLLRFVSGNSTRSVTLAGGTVVSVTKTTAAVPGYQNLFSIKSAATWRGGPLSSRTDSASLETYAITKPFEIF